MSWVEFPQPGAGGIARREIFTEDGTWTKPDGLIGEQVWVTAIGGGGSGAVDGGNGGGSGQFVQRLPVDVEGVSSVAVTVGDGGEAVVEPGESTDGNPGQPSSFGALVSVSGATGIASGSNYDYGDGAPGMSQFSDTSPAGSPGGVFGSSGGFRNTSNRGAGAGGLAIDGSGVSGGSDSLLAATGGLGYGAGGGGSSSTSGTSGAGAPGVVMVEWIEEV